MTARRHLFLIATLAALLAPTSRAQSPSRPPNIIFILIDDMGWMDLSCQGSSFFETPNIDRLASQGMRFTNAYAACPVCSPTRAAFQTGKYPARLHLTDWIPGHKRPWAKLKVPDFHQELPLEEITIAEVLKPLGYATAAIGKWHLGGEGFLPENQGYDLNVGGYSAGSPRSYFSPYMNPKLPDGPESEFLVDRLMDESIKFIEKNKDRPFFLYLPNYAVHQPIDAKPAVVEHYRQKLGTTPTRPDTQTNPIYAALIQGVDENVGRLLKTLDDLHLADNTLVVFTSDNGGLMAPGPTSNAPLRGGKGMLYEGGIREPLIVRWPGVIRPASTSDAPVITCDFFPTFVELTGSPNAPKDNIDGVSLMPLLKESGSLNRDALFWHYPHYHRGMPGGAIRDGDWKLIEFYQDGRLELYNLKDDPSEEHNLATDRPAVASRLHHKLADWRDSVHADMPTLNPDYDPHKADQGPESPKGKGKGKNKRKSTPAAE